VVDLSQTILKKDEKIWQFFDKFWPFFNGRAGGLAA